MKGFVCFETFGCRLNRAEALATEARYLAAGWVRTESHAEANVIVVRACSVTARAESDCEKLIAHLKQRYPKTRLVVEGCFAKKEGAHQLPEAPDAIPLRTARAYLKVQDGCNSTCAFCIVPRFRGPSRSVRFQEVLDRARRFADAGYSELVLTGCNLAQYLSDGKRFPDLLQALAAIDGCRVRIGSLEPGPCAADTVQVMAENENVCRFLHLPIQSGSERIVSAMRRPYTIHATNDLIRDALHRMPSLALGCDLMTGFPGESEIDFTATRGLLKRFPFSNVHVFPYSERPGTRAAQLSTAIEREVRISRAHTLTDLAAPKRRAFAHAFAGKTVEIVVEDAESIAGWTGEYLWCSLAPGIRGLMPVKARRKERLSYRVVSVHNDRLYGVPIAARSAPAIASQE